MAWSPNATQFDSKNLRLKISNDKKKAGLKLYSNEFWKFEFVNFELTIRFVIENESGFVKFKVTWLADFEEKIILRFEDDLKGSSKFKNSIISKSIRIKLESNQWRPSELHLKIFFVSYFLACRFWIQSSRQLSVNSDSLFKIVLSMRVCETFLIHFIVCKRHILIQVIFSL